MIIFITPILVCCIFGYNCMGLILSQSYEALSMASFDEVPFERIAERNHFCNLIASQQNGAIGIYSQVYLQGSQLVCDDCFIFFADVCLTFSSMCFNKRQEPCIYPCIDSGSWRIVGRWLILISASILIIRTSIWISSTKIFSALMFCHLRINSRPQKSQPLQLYQCNGLSIKCTLLTFILKLGTFHWRPLVS